MKSPRSLWLIFGACAGIVLLSLVWITVTVTQLERAELDARADAAHQEALRLALWRMDSWLAPLLAREAARPYFDYQPFYPQQRAYTALLEPIDPGEVLTPSPLLSFESQYVRLHFQVAPDGRLTSPQAPRGEFRDLAAQAYLPDEKIESNAATLDEIRGLVTREQVAACVAAAESQADANLPIEPPRPPVGSSDDGLVQKLRTQQELARRKGTYLQNVQRAGQGQQVVEDRDAGGDLPVAVGALVGFWDGGARDDGGGELVFTRPVRVGESQYYQGFLADWPKLRAALLNEISDLFAEAELVPLRRAPASEEAAGITLATIPVSLRVPPPPPIAAALLSPARWTLALTWLAVVAGIAAVAVTLRASIAFGERRSRFASAVTHELRTPLTTFRMYSEMLAEGMVKDRGQRQVYLDTLKDESARLSSLVENVLAYARLEEGRGPATPTATTLGDLLEQVVPPARQRAEAAGMVLRVENQAPPATALSVDAEAVGQILFNLIDNACKYAAGADDGTIHLSGRLTDGGVALCVRDHGPGVPGRLVKAIFAPFERGEPDPRDAQPGVGLGLALARGLARDLGGDLVLESSSGEGACFRLTLKGEGTKGLRD
ncbi:MAG: sensor histidine kinase [Planctomycetota bacterium]